MAISLSLVMLGLVSLAPTSSAKRRPTINLSISWKAKTGTFTTVQLVGMDGALQEKKICPVKQKAIIIIEVRTLSHSYPNVLIVHD